MGSLSRNNTIQKQPCLLKRYFIFKRTNCSNFSYVILHPTQSPISVSQVEGNKILHLHQAAAETERSFPKFLFSPFLSILKDLFVSLQIHFLPHVKPPGTFFFLFLWIAIFSVGFLFYLLKDNPVVYFPIKYQMFFSYFSERLPHRVEPDRRPLS